MPWKKSEPMEERIEFAIESVRPRTFGLLCREYGISSRDRIQMARALFAFGLVGMGEESRRPRSSPGAAEVKKWCARSCG